MIATDVKAVDSYNIDNAGLRLGSTLATSPAPRKQLGVPPSDKLTGESASNLLESGANGL